MLYTKKQVRENRARRRFGRNREIAGALRAGWSARKVSREFGLSYSWAKKLSARLKEGDSGERRSGSGRKRKTTERDDRFLRREAVKDRGPDEDCPRADELADSLEQHSGKTVSARTVTRRLHEADLKKCVKTQKPFVSRKNRLLRLKFAREHAGWTVEQWKLVLWTDESPFYLRCMRRQFCWRTPQQKWHPRCMQGTVKHQKKINVWGCFSWNGVGRFHRIHGIMDRFLYRQILIHQMRPSGRELIGENFVLAQDNDPKHTSRICRNYLNNQGIQFITWPAQSPDLNPIENVWSELNRRARKRKCNTEEQLYDVLHEEWQRLDANYLQKLIESMPNRCAEVIQHNGYPIDY